MKTISLLLVLLLTSYSFAQDQLITIKGDTLKGQISKIEHSSITLIKKASTFTTELKIDKKDISSIIFENGDVLRLNIIKSVVDVKNTIEFIPSEIALGRVGIAYSRFFKSNLELRVPIVFQVITQNQHLFGIKNQIGNNIGLQALYHPAGLHKKADYFLGLSLKGGESTTKTTYMGYNESSYSYTEEYSYEKHNFLFVEFINGFRVNFTDHFAIQGILGIGFFDNENVALVSVRSSIQLGTLIKF